MQALSLVVIRVRVRGAGTVSRGSPGQGEGASREPGRVGIGRASPWGVLCQMRDRGSATCHQRAAPGWASYHLPSVHVTDVSVYHSAKGAHGSVQQLEVALTIKFQ